MAGLPKSPGCCLLATLIFQSLPECWGGSPLILAETRTAGGMGDHGMGMPIARAFIFRTQFVPPDPSTGGQKQVSAGLGEIGWNWVLCPLNSQPYFHSSEMGDKGPSRIPSCCLDPTPQNTAVPVPERTPGPRGGCGSHWGKWISPDPGVPLPTEYLVTLQTGRQRWAGGRALVRSTHSASTSHLFWGRTSVPDWGPGRVGELVEGARCGGWPRTNFLRDGGP